MTAFEFLVLTTGSTFSGCLLAIWFTDEVKASLERKKKKADQELLTTIKKIENRNK